MPAEQSGFSPADHNDLLAGRVPCDIHRKLVNLEEWAPWFGADTTIVVSIKKPTLSEMTGIIVIL